MARSAPVEKFRGILKHLISSPAYSQHGRVLESVLLTFDTLFPEKIHPLDGLIKKHCSSDMRVCPICEELMEEKTGKFGKFLGCSNYPECKGTRSLDGNPTLSRELVKFLELAEDNPDEKKSNRFSKLEI